MRRASFDKNFSSTKRNITSDQGWYQTRSSTTKDVECKRMTYGHQTSNNLQRSVSADNVINRSRGFKPSDRHDPAKRNFLEHLTSKILHFEMDSGEATPVNLQKLLTPAMDTMELMQTKNKKMYASSCFYAPTHPTVEDQVELARRISYSLSDVKNMKSKGQSMYVNRKKRSVKWIHDGNGEDEEEEPASPMIKGKIPLKCMMNPNGKVMDIQGIQALGEEVNVGTSPMNAGKLFDIVRDLNNQKGRGAEIFAKRRKRSEKWVVDKEQCQTPPTPSGFPKSPNYPSKVDVGVNENSKFTSLPPLTSLPSPASNLDAKPFYNPFTLDLSLESVAPQRTGNDQRRGSYQSDTGNYGEVKKIYLREIAVGTEPDYPIGNDGDRFVGLEKSKRMITYDGSSNNGDQRGVNRRNKSLVTNGNGYTNNNNHHHHQHHYHHHHHKQEMTNRDNNGYTRRVNDRHSHNPQQQQQQQLYQQFRYREQQQQQNRQLDSDLPDENEYTPVPVKQLIQEFEKTCRPILQYKQLSPKIIPIVQQCPPLDNDISRFFESSQQQNHQHVTRASGNGIEPMSKRNGNDITKVTNGNSVINNNNNGNYINGNGYGTRNGYVGQPIQSMTQHYEEYDSSEEELDDSFDDSGSEINYRRDEIQRIYENSSQSYNNGDETRAASNITMDEYEMYVRQFDESNELFEAPPGFRNGDCENLPKDDDSNDDPKSMVLAMVASQEDILDTIKHLRNTPVLENLVGAPETHFYPDVANAKLGENTYQGPKIASFQSLTNYNTAPRGWDQAQTFYRPVTFGKQQEPIAYSDF